MPSEKKYKQECCKWEKKNKKVCLCVHKKSLPKLIKFLGAKKALYIRTNLECDARTFLLRRTKVIGTVKKILLHLHIYLAESPLSGGTV